MSEEVNNNTLNIDTSIFNDISKRKSFFSNVLKHFFYMIFISCVSCFLAIYISMNYYPLWVALLVFFIFSLLILNIINNYSIISKKKEFVFFKTMSFLMGFLISPLILVAGVKIVISTFIITTMLFLMLYFISTTISVEKANFFGQLAFKMFLIWFILFSINFVLIMFNVVNIVDKLELLISFISGIAFIFKTIYDFKKISTIEINNTNGNDDISFMEKYYAYRLYRNYFYFFQRILEFIEKKKKKKKK